MERDKKIYMRDMRTYLDRTKVGYCLSHPSVAFEYIMFYLGDTWAELTADELFMTDAMTGSWQARDVTDDDEARLRELPGTPASMNSRKVEMHHGAKSLANLSHDAHKSAS